MNELTQQHKIFLHCLTEHDHIGQGKAIKAPDLLKIYNEHSLEQITDTRKLRTLKEELNDFHEQCILSDNKVGYWIAQTFDEVLAYEKFLQSYSDNMFYQVKKVKENFMKKDGKQLSFV